MLEKAFIGKRKYWTWMGCLLFFMGAGLIAWLHQLSNGLSVTGMSRDISWGVYIANFTFLVGVAAAAVMVVLPYYIHHHKTFGRITILAEFLAVGAVTMCLMFILADLGNPPRVNNVVLHPTPNSILFWDMIVLNIYLILNIFVGWTVLSAERKSVAPPKWIKPFIYLSIPWAVSIHTVTAFLYAGLPGRHFWLTAIMAARFLASAFAAGPALLILACLIVRRNTKFDPGDGPIRTLSGVVAYAMILNVFFFLLEVFTGFYSQIPGHMHTIQYLFAGLHGHTGLVPWMWTAAFLAVGSIILLVVPAARRADDVLAVTCVMVFIACWIDKGVGLVIGGFIPNPMEHITEYVTTVPEVLITLGIWATGFFVMSALYKVAVTVKEELRA
jgi:molybdopterin-containing oxidoreductase family membrane subunit